MKKIDTLTHSLIHTLNKYISHDNVSRQVQKQYNSFKII